MSINNIFRKEMSTNSSLNQQKCDQEHHYSQQIHTRRSNQDLPDDSQNVGESPSSENLGRPNNEFPIRLEFATRVGPSHFYQSFSKCLLYVYSKLQQENDQINIQSKNQYQSTFISQLASFIDQNKKLFLYCLQLLTKQTFPKIQDLLKMDDDFFKNSLMTEMPTITLGSALRQIRLNENPKQEKQHTITLGQDFIKCLYIGSLLLCGCGVINLDQNSQSNEKTDKKFQRIVSALLRKTSMLTHTNFKYITEHWQSILHLILFQKIQTMTDDEDQTQMREESLSEISQSKEKKKPQTQAKGLTLKKQKSNPMSQEDEIYQDQQYINFSSFHNESSFFAHEIPDADQSQLNGFFSDQFQFKSSSSSKSSKSINNEQKSQMKTSLKNRAQKKESQQSAKKSRENRLKQRARKLFKYGQKRRQRKPTKKQLQKKKQKKVTKVKKPHPRHEKRQIDILIQFIIKDQFCIAYAIANHISNALDAQNMKLSLSN